MKKEKHTNFELPPHPSSLLPSQRPAAQWTAVALETHRRGPVSFVSRGITAEFGRKTLKRTRGVPQTRKAWRLVQGEALDVCWFINSWNLVIYSSETLSLINQIIEVNIAIVEGPRLVTVCRFLPKWFMSSPGECSPWLIRRDDFPKKWSSTTKMLTSQFNIQGWLG